MRLQSFEVQRFRNILDSGPIPVDDHVTCLVGKNESGKTAVLHALYRLNPAAPATFDVQADYPRWRLKPDQRASEELEDIDAVTATFRVDETELAATAPSPFRGPWATTCLSTCSSARTTFWSKARRTSRI